MIACVRRANENAGNLTSVVNNYRCRGTEREVTITILMHYDKQQTVVCRFMSTRCLKGEFHVSAHGQTVTSDHLLPLLLKQWKSLMQETETMP